MMGYIGYDPSAPGTINIQRYTAGTDFTAGTTTTLAITSNPGSTNNVDVYFDGQYQHHDQWSLTGTTITFTSAIPLGTLVVEVKYGKSVAINVPADASVTLAKLASQTIAGLGQALLINGKITTSVGSNALTAAVKTDAGTDPSTSDPVYVYFRKSTLTDSGFDRVAITSALSITVSSGSTLGHVSGRACTLFVYIINNSGTAELAVSSTPPDYAGIFADTRLISTTAEGGAGGADSATGIYSTTARSNVPWFCVAMLYSTQTTAGTWAANMTQVDQAPFMIPKYGFRVYRTSNQTGVANATWTKYNPTTEDFDLGGAYDLSGDNRYECVVGGLHSFEFQQRAVNPVDGMRSYAAIYVNGAQYAYSGLVLCGTTGGATVRTRHTIPLNTGDYVESYVYHDRGTNEDFDSGSVVSYFSGVRH